jgi:predicted ester cyclase
MSSSRRTARITIRTSHPSSPRVARGSALFEMFIEAFLDLSFQNEHMVAEGDLVAAHNLMRGTHRGAFMGIPPTGRSFSVYASDVCRFTDDGLISEHWGVFDMGSLLGQLGVSPPSAQR